MVYTTYKRNTCFELTLSLSIIPLNKIIRENAILLASLKNIRTYIYFLYFFVGIFYIVEIIKKDKYDSVRYESLKYCTYSFIPNQNNFNQKFIKTIVCNLYSLTQ